MGAGSIEVDVDNSTFLIGALPNDSFLVDNGYVVDILVAQNPHFTITGRINGIIYIDVNLTGPIVTALTMTWVENVFNLTNGYYKVTSSEDDQFEYLVPFPPAYTSTMKAYWTTDVIVLDPSCSWQTPTTISYVNSTLDVTLAESNLSLSYSDTDFGGMFLLSSNTLMCILNFSSNKWYLWLGLSIHVQQHKYGHCGLRRFHSFCL